MRKNFRMPLSMICILILNSCGSDSFTRYIPNNNSALNAETSHEKTADSTLKSYEATLPSGGTLIARDNSYFKSGTTSALLYLNADDINTEAKVRFEIKSTDETQQDNLPTLQPNYNSCTFNKTISSCQIVIDLSKSAKGRYEIIPMINGKPLNTIDFSVIATNS